ncbi:MAG TPA: DUF2304 domain-containing protein [Longimicrobiales bacterium]|nr:DUF2304 domain-containing protein [Longimicrobiales bacterium]
MTFQTLLMVLTGITTFYFLVATRNLAMQRLFVLVFFGTGFVFILKPDITNRIAVAMGIGRGADMIFYLSTLFLFALCFNFYLRFRRIQVILTGLVRETALRHPVSEYPGVLDRDGGDAPGQGAP